MFYTIRLRPHDRYIPVCRHQNDVGNGTRRERSLPCALHSPRPYIDSKVTLVCLWPSHSSHCCRPHPISIFRCLSLGCLSTPLSQVHEPVDRTISLKFCCAPDVWVAIRTEQDKRLHPVKFAVSRKKHISF